MGACKKTINSREGLLLEPVGPACFIASPFTSYNSVVINYLNKDALSVQVWWASETAIPLHILEVQLS